MIRTSLNRIAASTLKVYRTVTKIVIGDLNDRQEIIPTNTGSSLYVIFYKIIYKKQQKNRGWPACGKF
ncbi:MAG: hypothetical protein A2W25_15585 [candidate division Zixibacteria bacterium RBG_16_53_22]|nr:MAG: hypothetical protein A2W25_15585 [candidate division Zixibacteria bacterium RBG_16_53_22]